MSPVGKMGGFCEENEDWSQYVERVEFFFTANGIEGEERKRAVLLTVMGPEAFGLLKRLVEPRKVGRESFDSLVAIMRDHLESEPSDIVQRFRFNSRDRKPCESVALFNAELSKLAERCNFGRVRDDMLRDRLVCGVNDELIRRRLLSERGLTYERALEIALAIETAPKDVAAKSVTNTVLWSPQGAMETGSRLHRALRRCPSAWQEQEAMKSTRSRGSIGPIPVWLETQELMAEALQAVIMGLGIEVFRLLRAGVVPTSLRAKLCSLATQKFTSAIYAQLFYFMESCCHGRSTVLDFGKGDDYFLRSAEVLRIEMDSIGPLEEGIDLEDGSPEELVKKFPCAKCSYCFATMAAWQLHMERHRPVSSDKKHKCSECPYSTDDKRSLRIHSRVHTGEKPFNCSVCGKRFSQSSYRQRHMRIHNNDRPYSCTVCLKSFNRMSVLQQHTRIHTGERPYVCKVCAKAFSHPSSLQQHTRIHTGERPYVCKVCTKSFCHQSAFHKHSRTHTGERPHTCTLCGKAFREKEHCMRHVACCKCSVE